MYVAVAPILPRIKGLESPEVAHEISAFTLDRATWNGCAVCMPSGGGAIDGTQGLGRLSINFIEGGNLWQ